MTQSLYLNSESRDFFIFLLSSLTLNEELSSLRQFYKYCNGVMGLPSSSFN